jgi:hypothetical protein
MAIIGSSYITEGRKMRASILRQLLAIGLCGIASAATRLVPQQYVTIQAAIDDCNDGDVVIIAPGTYTGPGNRDIDYKGKAITVRSTDPNNSDIVAATIIDCNGTESDPHRGFNFHSGEDNNSVLAGLTVRNGFAATEYPAGTPSRFAPGGAIKCSNASSPLIRQCIITGNLAGWCHQCPPPEPNTGGVCRGPSCAPGKGAGIYTSGDSHPVIAQCTIINNAVIGNYQTGGGGIFCEQGSPVIANCTIANNNAYCGAGICYGDYSTPRIYDCVISNNKADHGGGVGRYGYKGIPHPLIQNCKLTANIAARGGALYPIYSEITVANCVFSGNVTSHGSTITLGGNDLLLINCTISDNTEDIDPFIPDPNLIGVPCGGAVLGKFELVNCIVWGNVASQWDGTYVQIEKYGVLKCSCVQNYSGTLPGAKNISADPCFASPGYWDPNGTPEDANDDFWVDGDYHLKSQAGRWQPAEISNFGFRTSNLPQGTWVKDDATSPCIDAGDPASPIGFEPFPNGGIVNMGAYGGTPEASKSYFGGPVCETIVAGDINGDCKVDFKDFSFIALHWLEARQQ